MLAFLLWLLSPTGTGISMAGSFTPAPGTNYSYGSEPTIAARLTTLAKALGIRLVGLSGYRTPAHSVAVGGFANDPHTQGKASDTPGVEGVPESTLEKYGLTRPFGGAAEADHIQLLPGFRGGRQSRGRSRGVTSNNTLNVPGYVPKTYVPWVRGAAQGTGLPASVVAAQINDESGFNPSVTSSAGAEGIAQFLPSTFKSYGKGSPYNAADSQTAYVNYMNTLLRQYNGNVRNALAAYNAGPGNLQAGYGYADAILSKAGVAASATAGGKSKYGATRPDGQPASQGSGGSSGQAVDAVFASYEQELNAPRVAPPGTKNPFQWWLMSFTGIWDQETGAVNAAGQGAATGVKQVAGG